MRRVGHQLDGADGGFDGTPRLPSAAALASWTGMLDVDYDRLVAEVEAGQAGVLDPYGATDRAEFFAVATESFFERPAELRAERPALYQAMRQYYGQDPAGGG